MGQVMYKHLVNSRKPLRLDYPLLPEDWNNLQLQTHC